MNKTSGWAAELGAGFSYSVLRLVSPDKGKVMFQRAINTGDEYSIAFARILLGIVSHA